MISSDSVSLVFRARGDSSDARKAFSDLKNSVQKDVSSIERTVSGTGFDKLDLQIASLANGIKGFGRGLQDLGRSLTAALTVPLGALATLGVRSAITLDDLRNKLISATGSVEAANQKFAELKRLSADSAGVLVDFAASTFAFLKPMQLAPETIDNFTKALGRIKLTDSGLDAEEFSRNLTQIFKQNFELADLKQLVGRFPRAAELLAEQFGIKSSDLGTLQETFQTMKETGKLTFEQFINGFAEAVQNDQALGLLTDTAGTRIAKAFERISLALAPLGSAILDVIEPFIPPLISLIETISEAFNNLSPAMRTAIVAFGALAAALGPVLIAAGAFAAGIGGIVTAAPIIGTALLAITGLAIQLAPALAAAAVAAGALYAAWTDNFGGIRDFTLQAWEKIRDVISTTMGFITGVVSRSVEAIVSFWRDNYSQIQGAVNTISENIKGILTAFFAAVQGFWETHGENIKQYVATAYAFIRNVVQTVIEQIGNVVRFGLAIINKDWDKAWKEFLNILKSTVSLAGQIFFGIIGVFQSALKAIVPMIIQYGTLFVTETTKWTTKIIVTVTTILATLPQQLITLIPRLVPKLIAAGNQIGAAVLDGIREALGQSAQAAITATVPVDVQAGISGEFKQAIDEQAAESEKARKEREKRAERESAAQITLLKNQLADAEKFYTQTLERLREKLKETGDFSAFREAATESLTTFRTQIEDILGELDRLEKEQAKAQKLTPSENVLIADEQVRRLSELNAKMKESVDDNNKLITESAKKESDKRIKISEEEAARKIKIAQSETERIVTEDEQRARKGEISNAEFAVRAGATRLQGLKLEKKALEDITQTEENRADILEKIGVIDNKITRQKIENEELWLEMVEKDAEKEQVIIDKLLRRLELEEELENRRRPVLDREGDQSITAPNPLEFLPDPSIFTQVFSDLETFLESEVPLKLGDMFQKMGQMITGAFIDIADAIGQTIQQWVLYGETGPAVMRKILASALASIAAEAAVQAIYATALGFLRLAQWDWSGAASAFTSAAIWASIAGIAALAGRAIAGSSFQRGNQAFSGQTQGGFGTQSQRGEGGDIFSQHRDKVILEMARNNSQTIPERPIYVQIESKGGVPFDDFFHMRINAGGRLYTDLKKFSD